MSDKKRHRRTERDERDALTDETRRCVKLTTRILTCNSRENLLARFYYRFNLKSGTRVYLSSDFREILHVVVVFVVRKRDVSYDDATLTL